MHDMIAFVTLTMGLAVEARYHVMPEMHGCVAMCDDRKFNI